MPTHLLGCACLFSVVFYSSCGQHAITLQYREVEEYTFSRAELRTIQAIADDTTREVRRLLPQLPGALVLEVFPAEDVLEELGYKGEEAAPRFLYWGVNPHHGEGVAATAEASLRPHLYQAFFRMLRFQSVNRRSTLDSVIGEGLIRCSPATTRLPAIRERITHRRSQTGSRNCWRCQRVVLRGNTGCVGIRTGDAGLVSRPEPILSIGRSRHRESRWLISSPHPLTR